MEMENAFCKFQTCIQNWIATKRLSTMFVNHDRIGLEIKIMMSALFKKLICFLCSVPTFFNLPEETLIKIADVLEEVGKTLNRYVIFRNPKIQMNILLDPL